MATRRNIANYTTFNSLLVNDLQIQSSGVGFSVYDTDPNQPIFSISPATQEVVITGKFAVLGDASFENITVSEFDAGMQTWAVNNPGDIWDIGLNAAYTTDVKKYTGIIRDASDSLKRWTFFKEIETAPTTEVIGIDSTKLDSVRMNYLYVNNGTAAAPSITFHNDTLADTGFYLAAENEIGVAAGGVKIAGIKYISPSLGEFQLSNTTVLKLLKLNTIDDIVSNNPLVTTGNIYISSESAKDKWLKFYSSIDEAVPSYSGGVFTSPTTNYFLTNTGSSLEFVYNNIVASVEAPPDYRNTPVKLLILSSNSLETKNPITVPLGGIGNLSIKFAGEVTTGFYRSGVNTIGAVCNGTTILNIAPNGATLTQPISLPDGSAAAPAIGFSDEVSDLTGLYRSGENQLGITTAGTLTANFVYSAVAPQLQLSSGGTAAVPTYTFAADTDTGMYLPLDEASSNQLAFSLGGVETIRMRRRTGTIATGLGDIEFFNSVVVTPDAVNKKMAVYSDTTIISNALSARGASFNAYNIIDDKLIFLYTFRSSDALTTDSSSNQYDSVAVGTPTVKSFEKDSSDVTKKDVLDLTANTSGSHYLSLNSLTTVFNTIDNVSISFWFKISGALSTNNTIFHAYNSTNTKGIFIRILSDGNVYANALEVKIESSSLTTLQYHSATLGDGVGASPVSIKDGLWHHVIIMLGDSSAAQYPKLALILDGETLETNEIYTTSGGDTGDITTATNSFVDLSSLTYISIGAAYNGAVSEKYTGFLKDIRLTNRFLNDYEIAALSVEPTIYAYNIDVAKLNVADLNLLSQTYYIDGTAATPSITFTNDTNTGIYRSTTDTLGVSAGGLEALTISSTIFDYGTNSMQLDTTKQWLKLRMNTGDAGPRIVFQQSGVAGAMHSIRSRHQGATVDGNYLDFFLFDTGATDADGLGNNQVMRLAVSAAVANSGIQYIYGISRVHDGSVSAPAVSFIDSPDTGLYRIGSQDLGISAGGAMRIRINTAVTVGTGRFDTVRFYTPLGSSSLPAYSFIGDTNTGIYSSGQDNMDITCAGTQIVNFTSAAQISKVPIHIDANSVESLLIRKQNDPPGGDIFSVDTTNDRIGFGYSSLFLSRMDSYSSTSYQRLSFDSIAALDNATGINIFNSAGTVANGIIASLLLGKNALTTNYADISFHYVSDASSSNRLQFGFINVTANQFNISADGSTNVMGVFTVGSTSSYSGQLNALVGSAGSPSYSFTGDTNTGIFHPAADQVAISTGGTSRLDIDNTYIQTSVPIRLSNGSAALPALTFTSDTSQDTGIYYIGSNKFGVSNGNQNTWIWERRGTGPHECLNEIYIKPDGSDIRAHFQDKKMSTSSNQTILNILPILHYKFASAPATNVSTQDESINKYIIEATTAAYVTSTVSLTDANGVGLLQYGAAQFASAAADRIETSTTATELIYLSNYKIAIKFKATNITSGSLYEIYGDRNGSTASNYIKVSIVSGNVNISIHNGSSIILDASTTSVPFTTNIWYNLILNLNASGNSLNLNGSPLSLTYSTGGAGTTITPAGFVNTSNLTVIVGGASVSILAYISEFYIAPTTTTEVATAIYRTQAHEIYTNKLQLATTSQGLVDEGYILRSDQGNNAVWDNSLQIAPGYVQLNSSKVLRLPNGTASTPAVSFVSDTNTGIYSGGADILAFVTGGVQRVSVSTSQVNLSSSMNILINNTSVPTNNSTGSLIAVGGIGLGNGSSTAARINFGSGYTTTSQASNRLIALLDASNNNYQFYGFGVQSGVLSYNVSSSSDSHIFYCGASSSTQTEIFRINGSGVVQAQDGAVGTPSYSFISSPDAGLYHIGTDNIGIAIAGVKKMDISVASTQISNDFQTLSGFKRNFTVYTAATLTLDDTYNIVELSYAVDTSDVIVTLPECILANKGREYTLIKTGAGGGNLVINTFDASDFIDDNATVQIVLINQFDKVTLISNGTNRWYTV